MTLLLEQLSLATVKEEQQRIQKEIEAVTKYFEECTFCLQNSASRQSYIRDIIAFTTNNEIEFDTIPHLFAFENVIFDLDEGCIVQAEPSRYNG